jgi:hypothetical protein
VPAIDHVLRASHAMSRSFNTAPGSIHRILHVKTATCRQGTSQRGGLRARGVLQQTGRLSMNLLYPLISPMSLRRKADGHTLRTARPGRSVWAVTAVSLAGAACAAMMALPAHAADVSADTVIAASAPTRFKMVRTPGTPYACLPNAYATVKITPKDGVEVMDVQAYNLKPYTEFDFFVIQVPNFPFGLSWYQGDMETDAYGNATARFVGRFSKETFIVAPGVAPAPDLSPIPTATSNPVTAPVHTFHLGLWFNSPYDAAAAGCADITTPFNGEHNAGVQILNTSNFPDVKGPLRKVK